MPKTTTLAGPMRCNCAALRKAARRVTSLYDSHLQDSGLTIGQFAVLDEIESHAKGSSASLSALAQVLVMDRTTLTRTLAPMERDKLIKTGIDPLDRRARSVTLTAEGRKRVALARSSWNRAQAHFAGSFGADKAVALQALLAEVTHADFDNTADRSI